ncbi:hypothetical protein AVEN_78801-1 [Araneus ventricosus]|uniref:Uncharacterized protein n=1 Tax=Araneus ventricosus TaxID=182803 RepID=A0A4Y2HGM4_ARAVE|nr:hypothetical protein AVEN_78801-1 [Araneus ventricosus]
MSREKKRIQVFQDNRIINRKEKIDECETQEKALTIKENYGKRKIQAATKNIIDGFTEDKLSSADLNDDEEECKDVEEECEEVIPDSFKGAEECEVMIPLSSKDAAVFIELILFVKSKCKIFNEHNSIHNVALNTRKQSADSQC